MARSVCAPIPRWVDLLVLLAAMTFAGWSTSRQAEWNFDVVCYVGAAIELAGEDEPEVHRQAYAEVRAVAPKAAYRSIAKSSAYRRKLAASPEAFGAQLPMYRNKPGYVALVAGLRAAGVNGANATRWISLGALLWIGVVVRLWLGNTGLLASVVSAGVVLSNPIHWAGSISNPDTLVAALALTGMWAICALGRSRAGLVILGVCVGCRPDAILLLLPAAAWLWLRAEPPRQVAWLDFAATCVWSLLVYLVVRYGLEGASLGAVLAHTFGERVVGAAQLEQSVTLSIYAEALWKGISGSYLYHPSSVWLFALLSVFACLLPPEGREGKAERALLLISWVYCAAHFLIFPTLLDRFFLVSYVLVLVVLAKSLRRAKHRLEAGLAQPQSDTPTQEQKV